MKYVFDWDPAKEQQNRSKHGVSFRQTMTVFRDAHAVTVYDAGHDDQEDRWVTIGRTANGLLLVLVHTHHGSSQKAMIRIISARRATRRERRDFEEGP